MFKKLATLAIFTVLALSLFACGSEENDVDESPVAMVNGEPISRVEFNDRLDRAKEDYEAQGIDFENETGQMYLEQIKNQQLETMIQQTLLLQVAESEGVEVTNDEIDSEVTRVRELYETEEAFNQALAQSNFTLDSYKEALEIDLTIDGYFDIVLDPVEVTEEAVQEYYDDYKEYLEEEEKEVPEFEDIEKAIEEQLIQEDKNTQIQALIESLMEVSEIERML